MRYCTIQDCERVLQARGMCSLHYKRAQRLTPSYIKKYGIHKPRGYYDKLPVNRHTIMGIIESRTNFTEGCWIWNGEQTINKYAWLRKNGKVYRLHRLMYELFIQKPDSKLVLDHLCEEKLCINPFHLEEVTIGENLRRYWENRKGQSND